MRFQELRLGGAFLIEPERREDERGFFARTWCRREFAAQGICCDWLQCSLSYNRRRGTLRGLHYQLAPWEEAKLVRCTLGAIFDVLVDLRPGSPHFGSWVGLELTARNRRMLYIPQGFAHGFQTLVDDTEVFYQISQEYHPEAGRGFRWNDPRLAISWPECAERILSEKDRQYPDFPSWTGALMAMDTGIEIRTIQPGDRPAVMELHRQHYWRNYCLLLNTDFYRWQFESAPDSLRIGGDQSLVAVDARGELLSFLGVVPAQCLFQGRGLRGAHLISWLSPPQARGRGVGGQIMNCMAERFDFLFGRSVTPAALAIYRRLGFRYFPHCSRWIGVLDPDATAGLAVDGRDAAHSRARARAVPHVREVSCGVSSTVPEGAPALAETVLSGSLTFARSRAYLHWRYVQHPCLRYTFLWIGQAAAPDGVAVVRVEDIAGRPGRVARIVEFLVPPAHGRRLAWAVLSYSRDQGCAFADLFGMSEKFVAGFVAAGAFDAREEPELRLPHLFQPWTPEVEAPGLLFFGKSSGTEEFGIRCIDDVPGIHVSKGDGNLDWPSWNPAANGVTLAPAVQGVSAAVA